MIFSYFKEISCLILLIVWQIVETPAAHHVQKLFLHPDIQMDNRVNGGAAEKAFKRSWGSSLLDFSLFLFFSGSSQFLLPFSSWLSVQLFSLDLMVFSVYKYPPLCVSAFWFSFKCSNHFFWISDKLIILHLGSSSSSHKHLCEGDEGRPWFKSQMCFCVSPSVFSSTVQKHASEADSLDCLLVDI